MKRPMILVLSCLCALLLSLFALTACGGSSSDSSSSKTANTASNSASSSENGDDANVEDFNEDEIRAAFEQVLMGMSEYYEGTTPVGEQLYYAGGSDGENAVFVLIVPESDTSVIFIGPVEVGDDNVLTVTDSTSGSTISFEVFDNGDGTYSFSMGENYGAAIMYRCTSTAIVDALTSSVMQAASAAAAAPESESPEAANAEGASGE